MVNVCIRRRSESKSFDVCSIFDENAQIYIASLADFPIGMC